MTNVHNRNRLIGSVAATLRILELLSDAGGPMTLTNITKASGYPKSSVHRMLSSLIHTGYVEQDESARYGLTFKVLRLGMDLLSSVDIVKASNPHLERLMLTTNESAYLSVLDSSGQTVYLAKVETPRPVQVQAKLGTPTPAWSTATGWAMLAFLPEQRDLALAQPLASSVPGAITSASELRVLLTEVAKRGCAVTRSQGNPDTGGIAAPIRDYTGTVIAACSIAIPQFRMDDALVRKCMPLVVQAASAISAEMGLVEKHRVKTRQIR